MGRDGGDRADDRRERLAGRDRDRHEHDQQQRGERRHDAEPAARGGPHAAEHEREGRERRQHDDRVDEQRVQREAGDLEHAGGAKRVHTR